VEVRCLRIDAPEWRFEQQHSWPSGISLFVDDQRVMKKVPDEEHDEAPGPFDLTRYTLRHPLSLISNPNLRVSAAISAKKTESWALGILLVEPLQQVEPLFKQVIDRQASVEERMELDLQRVRLWVMAHRPDRVSKKDTLRCVEPPVLKLMDCTSLMRIEKAVRGDQCEHLQCFDLEAYLHTMRSIPPKHAWCCPVCDKPAPIHQLRLDAFAQSVITESASNVIEVLVADNGKWEVSATEDPMEDDSSDENPFAPAAPKTQEQLQADLMNLGRSAFTPQPASKRQPPQPAKAVEAPSRGNRERSRSPRRSGKAAEAKAAATPTVEEQPLDKMLAWRKLQGIHQEPEKPPEPAAPEPPKEVKEEIRFGWLPEGKQCSKCEKIVVEKGGVLCGRKRKDGSIGGCSKGYCWKCMNKWKDEVGKIRTTKSEFSELGDDAWWMHEKCMTKEYKRLYFGEDDDDEDIGKPKDMEESDDEPSGKFAWE
jgi:hypothetical protein